MPMIILACGIVIYILFLTARNRKEDIESLTSSNNELRKRQSEIEQERDRAITEAAHSNARARFAKKQVAEEVERSNIQIRLAKKNAAELEILINQKAQFFPWLATAHADYQKLIGNKQEKYLRSKVRPAAKAADTVKEATSRAREAEYNFRILKYRIDFYEKYFPWITEVTGDTLHDLLEAQETAIEVSDETLAADPTSKFLSTAEFGSLSVSERNQLALDRWKTTRKSNWEIGRMYERYIGYKYEQRGYQVNYFGATQGLDDLGRDLISKKDGVTKIVQCKYWSREKTIHEKHIFQLFGSVVEYIAQENMRDDSPSLFSGFEILADIKPVFVTSTRLSDRAREFASILKVELFEDVGLGEYPLIKCNISKASGERVYHLPFDQQYDRTKIEPKTGELYASTVSEAESRGFRRAYRWKPTSAD